MRTIKEAATPLVEAAMPPAHDGLMRDEAQPDPSGAHRVVLVLGRLSGDQLVRAGPTVGGPGPRLQCRVHGLYCGRVWRVSTPVEA